MDFSIFVHPSFLLFAGAQAGVAVLLWLFTELLHRRALRRGTEPVIVKKSRFVCRAALLSLFAIGTACYVVPSYHPLLGEATLRNAYAAIERDDMKAARKLLGEAVVHLAQVDRATEDGGVWGSVVGRFLRSWGGRQAVRSALGTAHFLLGDCPRALPFLQREMGHPTSASRTALLSYRLAVCHADKGAGAGTEEAEDALLRALLIDRRYATKAKSDPRLRPIAENLLSKRL